MQLKMINKQIPYFSVIIPMFNRETIIIKALNSLKNQTFKNFETIIVDDCSTDNSYLIAKNYSLENKIVIKNTKNSERCITRNNGINISKGKYICFLDSDDYYLKSHLQKLFNFISTEKETKSIFFTNAFNETEDGKRTSRICPKYNNFEPYTYLLRYTPNPLRWAIHQDILKNLKFDPKVTICEDLDLLLRIKAKKYEIKHLAEETTVYVSSSDSFTHGDKEKAEKELKYFKLIFNKLELKGLLPKKETNRLLSMCYFHLSTKNFSEGYKLRTIINSIKSYLLFPKGYNKKTNKILLVNLVYSIPLIGYFIKTLIKISK